MTVDGASPAGDLEPRGEALDLGRILAVTAGVGGPLAEMMTGMPAAYGEAISHYRRGGLQKWNLRLKLLSRGLEIVRSSWTFIVTSISC